MIDVSEILEDSDLCSDFTIERSTGKFALGGWQADEPQIINTMGAVRNTSGQEIQSLPEADRVSNSLTFRTVTPLFTTTPSNDDGNAQTSDVLVFQGSHYRVIAVKNYSEQGYYFAIAARMEGN